MTESPDWPRVLSSPTQMDLGVSDWLFLLSAHGGSYGQVRQTCPPRTVKHIWRQAATLITGRVGQTDDRPLRFCFWGTSNKLCTLDGAFPDTYLYFIYVKIKICQIGRICSHLCLSVSQRDYFKITGRIESNLVEGCGIVQGDRSFYIYIFFTFHWLPEE